MTLRDIRPSSAVVLVAACWLGAPVVGRAPHLSAQQLEVDPRTRTVEQARRDAREGLRRLNTLVDLKDFPPEMTVKEALQMLYDEANKQGVELGLAVNIHAVKQEHRHLSLYDAPIKTAGLPRRMTAAMFVK